MAATNPVERVPKTALVLVAIMPDVRDLEIARLLGWYRIPMRKAPKVIDVDYLAFYQTSAFGDDARWQIQYFAGVRGYELTYRSALLADEPDHPRAQEEYYKVQLEPLQKLAQPIRAGKWRRVTFFYTTGEYLYSARTLSELVVKTDERDVLWRSLRERALQSGHYQAHELPEIPVDPALLALLGAIRPAPMKDPTGKK